MKVLIYWILLTMPYFVAANEKATIKAKKEALVNTSKIHPESLLEVLKAQLQAIRDHDYEKAYKDYTSEEFKKNVSLDEFKKLIEKFQPLLNNKLFQFQSFYTEDNIASFGGELLSVEGMAIPVEYDFVRENGNWKILGIQVYQNELSLPQGE